MEYTLFCPNALVVKKKGLTISTSFTYKSKEEAMLHKAACDKWDIEQGNEPQSYIEETMEESSEVTRIASK